MDENNPSDCYIFRGDKSCPTVMHFPLFNNVNCSGKMLYAALSLYICISCSQHIRIQCQACQSSPLLSAAAASGDRREGAGQTL